MSEKRIEQTENAPAKKFVWAELTVIAIAVIGAVFKIQHWLGANIMIATGLAGLTIIYFPFGFYFWGSNGVKPTALVAGLLLSFIPMGILFKSLHWPGAAMLLYIALVSAPLVVVGMLFMRKNASPENLGFYNNMLIRAVLLSLILFVIALIRMY